MLELIISLFAPHHCIGCGDEGKLLCEPCQQSFTPVASRCYACKRLSRGGRTCDACRRNSKVFAVYVVTRYEGVASTLIGALKFRGARSAVDIIASQMASFLPSEEYVVVHLPTASSRIRQRGFDQSRLIAERLAYRLSLPYCAVLGRSTQHRQVGAARTQRLEQLRQSFYVRDVRSIQGKRVLLVDDVLTTGASVEAAARQLRAAGARRVDVVVFARA